MYQMARAERLLAYAIAAAAGFVDAAGFLAADRYFVSFMSGNTTRLGVELARGSGAALIAALLLGGFIVGVAAGALVAERCGQRRKSAVLALSAGLLAMAGAGAAMGQPLAFLGCAVLAMGAINNVFRKQGEVALGVTYMTGALVRVGEGLAALLNPRIKGRKSALPSLLLWASLSGGGLLGALAFLNLGGSAPWLATAWLVALTLAARAIERRDPQSS